MSHWKERNWPNTQICVLLPVSNFGQSKQRDVSNPSLFLLIFPKNSVFSEMAENEIGFRCVRCKKCPPDAPVMDPASFQEHFAIEHMSKPPQAEFSSCSLDIPGFKCACGKKFATILYATLHTCQQKIY